MSGTKFIELVQCNPVQSRSFLSHKGLTQTRVSTFKFYLKCCKCEGNEFDFAHHFVSFSMFQSARVLAIEVYFILIFALNFL